ncbi:peptidoglycan-binding domain-containing protein [Cellulomonas fimi]|uniref:Peptidoglycan-binding domain 1 protein n=1 Tax=Cellulomonas fimi (strain ATCC 484 / DSM 20113 / JCM 1341 / CCUG 24087 / LMG 16345 / NBRC 15513 / NCIMB 8980 / NCTC 7547 / NRS-133) TaxID=590998 RepID=F4H7L7_CELFA|nr:hypothetical protein [Cellulomonas fimi]AEE44574.1 Peptidoglycan-binding domain 1 protein [Cellulomonas fimi ATCC 484]NNH06450.1 hypothetical protein [Cellulomonas fimi]VEH26665.1 spore cortex-lytic enzyme [Cellulomonas fimi]
MRRASARRQPDHEAAEPAERRASPPAALLALQATAGNRAVAGLLGAARSPRADAVALQRALTSPRFASDTVLQDVEAGRATLARGATGDPVRKVQHAVHDAGVLFRTFGVDGIFEAETARRVRQYQQRESVGGDTAGAVGAHTIRSLDARFPAMALPSTAGDPYTFAGMKAVLAQWNSAMLADLQNLRVEMVAGLSWADEQFDGTGWVPHPMPGAGETAGTSITIATGDTNENVAKSLYHEYQHARQPRAYQTRSWEAEETRVFEMETYWAIDRGLAADPGLTTTDPTTGAVSIDPSGVGATVGSYPGVGGPAVGEVIAKVGATRVRVRMPNGSITVRNAVAGDTVPGPRTITPPRHVVAAAEWR